jgi:hypothetical protein
MIRAITLAALSALALVTPGSPHAADVSSPALYLAASQPPSTVPRDSHGRIKRSREARDAFKRSHPCPAAGKTRGAGAGYVIDHVIALKRGGADAPSNMPMADRAGGEGEGRPCPSNTVKRRRAASTLKLL